jgi:predicted CoA-binding protein
MKTVRQQIDDFLKSKHIALAGVSRNKKKFGYQCYKALLEKGYSVYPMNPNAENIDGKKCFKRIADLPSEVDSILIVTPGKSTDEVLRQAIERGMKNIWVQQMSETKGTLSIAEEYQKEIVTGKCIFMFAEPVAGVHKFHRMLVKWFGALPK